MKGFRRRAEIAQVRRGSSAEPAKVDEFAQFYWWHMRKEEEQLLPLALQYLDAEDWQRVDSAFGDNADPLFGADLAEEYRQLYQRIAELAPRSLCALLESGAG